jgi:hypothetical protein
VVLLGSGNLGRSLHAAISKACHGSIVWATRRPRCPQHIAIDQALAELRADDCLLAALASCDYFLDADTFKGVHTIDLCEPRAIRNADVTAGEIIEQSRDRLAPQTCAINRASHRLTAIAEAALAECICPAIKSLNRAISAFRTRIVEAEFARLSPLLAMLDEEKVEAVRRSIRHAAARTSHPLHEYVNALGRMGRAAEAQLLVDHILGSRIGIGDETSNGTVRVHGGTR